MIIKVLAFIIVFTIIVLAHEIGHFIFARLAGIRVLELGMGLGPKLFGIIKNKTKYTLNLLPIGGFVRIAGLDEKTGDPSETFSKEESYLSKSAGQKGMAIFGGPAFNLLLAFIIYYAMFVVTGVPVDTSNQIATVSPGSVADKVGLISGDKIIALSGRKVEKMIETVNIIHKSAGKELILSIDRAGKVFNVKVTPRYNEKMKIGLIGFSFKPVYARTNPLMALYKSLEQVVIGSALIIFTLALLIIGKISLLDLAGPVGIAQFTGQVAGEGIIPLLSFTAFLSINLGILNLLPIPALDGGRLVFIGIEAIRKKAVDIETENKIHQIGFALLLAIMALVTANDILRLIRR